MFTAIGIADSPQPPRQIQVPGKLIILYSYTVIELRAKVHQNEDLRLKSISYLFFSTQAEQQDVGSVSLNFRDKAIVVLAGGL